MSQPDKGSGKEEPAFFMSFQDPAPSDKDQPQDSPESEEPANIPEEEGEEPETDNPEQPLDDADSEEDPDDPEKKRFKYWQSAADKAKAQLKKVEAELAELKKLPQEAIDLADAMLKDPTVVDVVQEYLQTGRRPSAPSAPTNSAREQLKALKPPQAPVRPDNYDEDDAFTDLRSESAKYLQAERKYEKELTNYLLKRDELRDLVEQETEQEYRQRASMEEQNRKLRAELVSAHGLKPTELDEFFAVVSAKPTTADAVLFYKAKKGLLKTAVTANQKQQELANKKGLADQNPPVPGQRQGPAKQEKPTESFFVRR